MLFNFKLTFFDIWIDFLKFLVMNSQFFLHGWLEGLQGFHLERVWLHENFYFLVRKCLDFRGKNLKNNSSPFFSNMVRARAFNLYRPLIDTIKPYNFYCKHFWLRSFHSNISSVPLLLWEFRLTVRHCTILCIPANFGLEAVCDLALKALWSLKRYDYFSYATTCQI